MSKPDSNIDSSGVSRDQLLQEAAALDQHSPTLSTSDIILKLRKTHPTTDREIIAEAVETVRSRPLAVSKLGDWANEGRFSRAVLEQASRSAIAEHRARYFSGLAHVLEIGTGTGSDTAALAKICGQVTTIEFDPARAEQARHNLNIQHISNVTVLTGDAMVVLRGLELSQFDGLFADPARRSTDGDRKKAGNDYSPPLSWLIESSVGKIRAIKVSPGLFFDAPSIGWTRQFIGYDDECLEQTLWYGAPVPDSSVHIAGTDIGWAPAGRVAPLLPPDTLRGYIVEAHAAVNRSQYLGEFFAERDIASIASDVAYGITTVRPSRSPLLSSFEILEVMSYNLKTLRDTLRKLAWTSRTEIKKRNFPVNPEEVRAALDLTPHSHGAAFGTIFLFRWKGKSWAVLARRMQ